MKTNTYQIVQSVNGRLQAMIVQSILEGARIPVQVRSSRQNAYLDVMVPQECVFNASEILTPTGRTAEVCSRLAG